MSLMGDPSVKATEESRDVAQEYKSDAIDVIVNSVFHFLLLLLTNIFLINFLRLI